MLIRTKLLILLCVVCTVFAGLVYTIEKKVFIRQALEHEQRELLLTGARAMVAIERELSDLSRFADDYASWDDTYSFMEDADPDYLASNFVPEMFEGNEINLVCIVDLEGAIRYARFYDLVDGAFHDLAPFTSESVPLKASWSRHADAGSCTNGMIGTQRGVLMIASEPILPSEATGPVRGTLIVGRLLDERRMARVRDLVRIAMEIIPAEAYPIPIGMAATTQDRRSGPPHVLDTRLPSTAFAYFPVPDIEGAPLIVLQVSMDRIFLAEAWQSARFAMVVVLAGGLAGLIAILIFVESQVLRRLGAVGRFVAKIRQTHDLTTRLPASRHDEVGHMAQGINEMLEELQETEQSLRSSQEHLELALQGADLGLWDWDIQTGKCLFDDRWTEMLGYERHEIDPDIKGWEGLIHPEDQVRFESARAAHLNGKSDQLDAVYRLRRKGEGWEWVLVRGKVVARSPDGAALRMSGTHLDVTKTRLAEERYTMLFEQMLRGFALFEIVAGTDGEPEDYRFVEVNPAFETQTGLISADVIGKSVVDVFPDVRERWLRLFRNVARTGQPEHAEDYTGELDRYYELTVFAPSIGQLAVIFRDVSEKRRAEQEHNRLQTQIQQTQKLESLGVLAGGIAHDFNNLLMGIMGNTDLARDDIPDDSPAHESLKEIETASKRAAELCRQMLAYSGRGRFVVESMDLNAVIQEMSQLINVSISKKAELELDLALKLPAIEADITQIRQIVMNLIINASEALGEMPGHIRISTGVVDCARRELSRSHVNPDLPAGPYVYLQVQDTGCGMSNEVRDRIFDPFYTTKFTGRGLGLGAVMGIMRGHRGAILVDTAPQNGTIFKILFPPGTRNAPSANTDSESVEFGAFRGIGTVLIVDDEPTVMHTAVGLLSKMGFDIMTAVDGREAVSVFERHCHQIVCVILDLTMPEMDGVEAYQHLRKIHARTPIVISSGYEESELDDRFTGPGIFAFLQKPYQRSALEATMRKVLEQDRDLESASLSSSS
ncbi:MAG: PAS domain-containing protein [Verrucomicrobia bacterium]|nr:PAS domain-containing protein [Verrucomicrobiota bacterium]MDA1085635.1 PAS domain-containing protein [Verrucomicrobiota bacterium]